VEQFDQAIAARQGVTSFLRKKNKLIRSSDVTDPLLQCH